MIDFLLNHSPLLYLTQSLWRDEVFSVLMSESSLPQIVKLTVSDFNPPLYYFLLHFWVKIFGSGEIAIRMLSFIFHLLLVYVCYKFAKKIFKSSIFYLLFSIFVFFNPMLIYYAFEARMYSLLAFLATASMYFFYSKNWVPYILTSALGLWTQPFMAFVILSQVAYSILTKSFKKPYLLSLIAILVLFSPWLPVILFQLTRSGPMWIWPINLTTVTAILGNLFTGYEGTPWNLWNKMKIISIIILSLGLFTLYQIKWYNQDRRQRTEFVPLVLTWIFLPIILVLIISYFKPIYVNRYLIFVTVAEVFLIVIGISLIKNKLIRNLFSIFYFLFSIFFNFWFPPLHKKLDLRITIKEIEKLAKPADLVYSQTPLTFFEATYYFKDRSRVFLYKPPGRLSSGVGVPASNPNEPEIPSYLGPVLITKEKWAEAFPNYPRKAFLIYDDANYEVISQR